MKYILIFRTKKTVKNKEMSLKTQGPEPGAGNK